MTTGQQPLFDDGETITINKQTLWNALIKLERQCTLNNFLLYTCITRLHETADQLAAVWKSDGLMQAKKDVYALLFPGGEISASAKNLLEDWLAEFEAEQRERDEPV